MKIESIRNYTYPTYKTISFKSDIETETATPTVQAEAVQFKSAVKEGQSMSGMRKVLRNIGNAFTVRDPNLDGVAISYLI